jgi:hypothetical protein
LFHDLFKLVERAFEGLSRPGASLLIRHAAILTGVVRASLVTLYPFATRSLAGQQKRTRISSVAAQ